MISSLCVLPRVYLLSLVTLLGIATGCGGTSGPFRYSVSGTATFEGKPIPVGSIVFEPDEAARNRGPRCQGKIIDGKYSISEASGHIGGQHVVYLNGYDGRAETTDGESENGKALFATFKTDCSLPHATHKWDVVVRREKTPQ